MTGNTFQLLQIMVSMIVIAELKSVINASKTPLCLDASKPCARNEDCCTGCCFKEKCISDLKSCTMSENPCFLHECPPNSVCHLQQVQCIRAPCPPIPICSPMKKT